VAICHITIPYNPDDRKTILPNPSLITVTLLYAIYAKDVVEWVSGGKKKRKKKKKKKIRHTQLTVDLSYGLKIEEMIMLVL
jgi:hypothetical protein